MYILANKIDYLWKSPPLIPMSPLAPYEHDKELIGIANGPPPILSPVPSQGPHTLSPHREILTRNYLGYRGGGI